jgi:ABC-type Fe3+ transport system permease subunit
MTHPPHAARLLPVAIVATALVSILLSPTVTLLPRIAERTRHLRDDERGELVQNILWVAGFAAIAIAVIAIIRTFVLSEAENLPGTGN